MISFRCTVGLAVLAAMLAIPATASAQAEDEAFRRLREALALLAEWQIPPRSGA